MNSLEKKIEEYKVVLPTYNNELVSVKSIDSIVGIKTGGYKSLNKLIEQNDKKQIKLMVFCIVSSYVDLVVLPLPNIHVEMVTDWIMSDYNERTKMGGCRGYTFQDIHMVFKNGIIGNYGQPSGHKYVLPEIIGKNGWFEQYHRIRNKELGDYYYKKNKESSESQEYDLSKVVPSPNAKKFKEEIELLDKKGLKIKRPYLNHPKDNRKINKSDEAMIERIVKN